jgi:hypothetical protein
VAVVAAVVVVLLSTNASLTSDPAALAQVGMPFEGGTIQSVDVIGPRERQIPIAVRDGKLWPTRLVPANVPVAIQVVVKRPGWIGWLAGDKQTLLLTLRTPVTSLRQHYLTLHTGAPVGLQFANAVSWVAYGAPGQLRHHALAAPTTSYSLPRTAAAGSILVAAAPRTWESARPAMVSWFPTGAAASAVASPAPGTTISPTTPITLTFSKPIRQALGSARPPVSPATPGTWHTINSHTIQFRPAGFGYGLAAAVTMALPRGVQLVGGQTGSASTGRWHVPAGSTLRLQQILAQLGYLPLDWRAAGPTVATDPTAQENAAINPPVGTFTWRYPNVPSALHSFWTPGSAGVMTRGALMSFENDHGLATDGAAGPDVWRLLLTASIAGKRSSFGYTFVTVSLGGQSIDVWHSGKTVVTGPVNTGIASRPTASGTYFVYEHIAIGTMSGTNPDGSHYNDPGIQYISYFNGGDALHAFNRAQYGFPQSLGCVEMPTGEAGSVYPYTPIGTLVHVA